MKGGTTALPEKSEFSLLGPPFITQIRVVFLYLNAKTKKLYIWVCGCVLFLKEKNHPGRWEPDSRSRVSNKALLFWGVGGEGGGV